MRDQRARSSRCRDAQDRLRPVEEIARIAIHRRAELGLTQQMVAGRMAERDQLVALDAPVLSIGSDLDGVETRSSIEPEGQPGSIELIRTALDEIRRLTEGDGAQLDGASGDASTVSSTVRGGTGAHRVARAGYAEPRNPSSRARSGTGWDRMNKRSSGS